MGHTIIEVYDSAIVYHVIIIERPKKIPYILKKRNIFVFFCFCFCNLIYMRKTYKLLICKCKIAKHANCKVKVLHTTKYAQI